MSEHWSDHDDSDSQNDDTNNQQLNFSTQPVVELDDNWTLKSSNNRNQFSKLFNQGEATFLETEPNETSFVNSNREQDVSLFIYLNILKNVFFSYRLLPKQVDQSIWLIKPNNHMTIIYFHLMNLIQILEMFLPFQKRIMLNNHHHQLELKLK